MDITVTSTAQPWGTEHTTSCTGCGYNRHRASLKDAENDQLTHDCTELGSHPMPHHSAQAEPEAGS
jgi:hypothetical protein